MAVIRRFIQKLKLFFYHIRHRSKVENKNILLVILDELKKNSAKLIFYGVIALLAFLVITPIGTYLYFVRDLSSKEKIINRNNAGVILLDRNGTPFFTFYNARTKNLVPIDQIPEDLQNAVIAVEDKDFYKHQGFSPTAVVRAIITNLEEQEIAIGGSTITQQLVKNALLTPDRNFLRKYQELFLALELDRRYEKPDILEMYLNTVYFGENAFGIDAAAKNYFGKNPSELTLSESALLAAILPAPSAYSPISGDPDIAFGRQEVVLNEMVKQGYITEDEKNAAIEEEIAFNPTESDLNIVAPHFALMVKEELINRYGEQRVAGSGFIVTTTLDLPLQEYTEETVANQVSRLRANDATNGAAVVLDPLTGEIISLVGSHNWFDEENGKINMAIRPRQPGSSYKPIIYADAFDRKLITPATELSDVETTFPGNYKPKNYDNQFRGEILARFALAQSLNIPAVEVMEDVEVENAIEFSERLGITTLLSPSNYGLSFVLGAPEVPLTEMTSVYGVFASGGELAERTTIIKIQDKNGRDVFEQKPNLKRVLGRGVSFQISSILSDNAARQPTFGNSLTISRPAAVKTGTTEEYRDALTIGYTPQIVVGVWIGNNDNTPMDSVAGSLGAAPIWRLVIEKFLQGKPVEQFVKPSNVDQQEVCRENGLRALAATSSAYMEYFLPGTVPRGICSGSENQDDTDQPTPTDTPTPTSQPTEASQPTAQPTQIPETPTPTIPLEPTATPIIIQLP